MAMESETAQELMEIQSALQEELDIKSEMNCDLDEFGTTGDTCTTFKRPLSCSKCGKAFMSKWKLECPSTQERNHSAALSVTTNALTQVL